MNVAVRSLHRIAAGLEVDVHTVCAAAVCAAAIMLVAVAFACVRAQWRAAAATDADQINVGAGSAFKDVGVVDSLAHLQSVLPRMLHGNHDAAQLRVFANHVETHRAALNAYVIIVQAVPRVYCMPHMRMRVERIQREDAHFGEIVRALQLRHAEFESAEAEAAL